MHSPLTRLHASTALLQLFRRCLLPPSDRLGATDAAPLSAFKDTSNLASIRTASFNTYHADDGGPESHAIHAFVPRAAAPKGAYTAAPAPLLQHRCSGDVLPLGGAARQKRHSAGAAECPQAQHMHATRCLAMPLSDEGPVKGPGAHAQSSFKHTALQNTEQQIAALRSMHSIESTAQRRYAALGSTMHTDAAAASQPLWCASVLDHCS